MNDTHDERGGDADPYDWDPVYAAVTIAELQKQLAAATERADLVEAQVVETQAERNEWQRRAQRGHVVAEVLRADLNAATARVESATVLPERWRALIAERDEARELARVSLDILCNVSDEPMCELFEVDDMDELPDWFTGYGKPSAAQAPDPAQEARSATETAENGVQASGSELEFGGRSAGLSEPELFADACDCECQPSQPCLCPERDCYCRPCRVCGDNPQRTDDDTTEDER